MRVTAADLVRAIAELPRNQNYHYINLANKARIPIEDVTLPAYTPEFYFCYPGRIEASASASRVKRGHKHLLWLPDEPHEQGVLTPRNTEIVISEIPTVEAIYEALVVPEDLIEGMNIEVA